MTASRLSIFPTVVAAYGDVWRALLTMRTLAICMLFIILALAAAGDLVPTWVWDSLVLSNLVSFAADAVGSFFLTPFMIALHRFILRGEVTRGYALDPRQPGFMAFFGWLVAMAAVGVLALLLQYWLSTIDLSPIAGSAADIAVIVAMAILLLPLSILFPAIAIEARGAALGNALADIKGHVFRIFMIFLLALLPVMAVTIGATLMLGDGAAVIRLAARAVIQIMTLSLSVAVASRVFEALADRVLRAD